MHSRRLTVKDLFEQVLEDIMLTAAKITEDRAGVGVPVQGEGCQLEARRPTLRPRDHQFQVRVRESAVQPRREKEAGLFRGKTKVTPAHFGKLLIRAQPGERE